MYTVETENRHLLFIKFEIHAQSTSGGFLMVDDFRGPAGRSDHLLLLLWPRMNIPLVPI